MKHLSGSAKQVVLKFISKPNADRFVRAHHYSGKVTIGGRINFGCFLNDRLVGVLQYGEPMDRRKCVSFVRGTKWNDFYELNRMVFVTDTPKNIESRALAISFMLIKKHFPNVGWVLSFADGTQCGSGTIYRATGFLLTQIRPNTTLFRIKDTGEVFAKITMESRTNHLRNEMFKAGYCNWKKYFNECRGGYERLEGYQLRYIKLLKPELKLNVNTIKYSELDKLVFPTGVRHKVNFNAQEA